MGDAGGISDGFHTFDELYEHRHALFIALCRSLRHSGRLLKPRVWRSRKHADGTMYPDWFIMGIGSAPGSQISYHLPAYLWKETDDCAETLEHAPEWDGHTSADVVARLKEVL